MMSRSEQALSNLANLVSWIASGCLVFAAVSKFGGWKIAATVWETAGM